MNPHQRANGPIRLTKCLIAGAVLVFLTGCAHGKIPGTEIDDTDDTRAIIGVMEKYRQAMEARDPNGVLALVSENFQDDGGTGDPTDDLDYKTLRQVLPDRLKRVDEIRLDMDVKKVTVHNDDDTAEAIYYFTETYRVPTLTTKMQQDSGLKMMMLKKVGKDWKLLSGI